VVRAALPHLKANHGRVVTVASTLGIKAVSDATAYCASKFGVVGFTRALAAETAGEVGVTLLIPGGMTTHFFDGRPEQYKPGPPARLLQDCGVIDAVVPTTGLDGVPPGAGLGPHVAVNLHGRGPTSHRLLLAGGPDELIGYASPQAGVDGPAWNPTEHEVRR